MDDTIDSYCFVAKGSGGDTFCTNVGCKIASHKSKVKFKVMKGDVFIEKVSGAAFSKKFLNAEFLDSSLLEAWLNSVITMEDWTDLFALATAGLKKEPKKKIDFKILQEEHSDKVKICQWKTPRKRKIKEEPSLTKHQKLLNDDNKELSQTDLISIIVQLDSRVTELLNGVDFLRGIQVEDSTLVYDYFTSSDDKFEGIFNSIGTKPIDVDPSMDAPDLWLAVTSIITTLKQIPLDLTSVISKLTKPIEEAVERKIDVKVVNDKFTRMANQISQLQDHCIALTNEISNQYDLIADRTPTTPLNQTLLASNLTTQAEVEMESRLTNLEGEIQALQSAGDHSVIKCGDLGFKTLGDASRWLQDHFQSDSSLFGYLLDFHMMMHHISSESSSGLGTTDAYVSKRMGKASKLNFNGIAETTAVDSFGFKIPIYFSANKDGSIIRDNQSYFSKIRNFSDWSHPHEGKREKLKQRLEDFRYSFESIITQNTVALSKFNLLCLRALADCLSWTEDLMKFIDDTYNTYYLAHFGADKAWHVTTRLASKLIQIVAQPSIGMEISFKSQNNSQIGDIIFYTALRALDQMMVK